MIKFEDILIGCLKRWKSIVIFAIFTGILAMFVSRNSDEVITYQGNFKVFVKNEAVITENNIEIKKDQNLIQNYIELIKTRNFAENALKRTDLKLTPQQVLSGLTLVNIDKSDFIQIKYVSDDKVQTEKVLGAIRDEFIDVANEYNKNAKVSIEENLGIIEKTDIRNNKMLILIGLVGGLGLGIIIAFVLECINKTFRTKGEVERELKVAVIGSIPHVKSKKSMEFINGYGEETIITEAYNSLATNIKYKKESNDNKVLLVTSSIIGEGSSVTTANLAKALSSSHRNVLIIDADLRKPSINKLFNVENTNGLTELLLGEKSFENVVKNINKNISIITAGEKNVNPVELLDSKEMDELLKEAKEKYDYILIDTPPLQAVTDAKLLSTKADEVILVVKAESIKKDIARESLELIRNVQGNLSGIVFNYADTIRNKYYKYGK